MAHGPLVRILAPAAVTLVRDGLVLRGSYTVQVTVQGAAPEAVYGLALGPALPAGVRCGVREGRAALEGADAVVPVESGRPTTLALEVAGDRVTCRVNGVEAGTLLRPWGADEPVAVGVAVGAGTDVQVGGLRVVGLLPAPREER
jgi:hypothetical protein